MPDRDHDFDVLDRWAILPDAELEKAITNDAIRTLQRVVSLLGDENQNKKQVVSRDNFISVVREMRMLKKTGSRRLGEAILEASDWLDKNQPAKAKEAYERFLSSCTSKFYRDIAKTQMGKLP